MIHVVMTAPTKLRAPVEILLIVAKEFRMLRMSSGHILHNKILLCQPNNTKASNSCKFLTTISNKSSLMFRV